MAITKIIAIRDRLDKRINYAVNGEKTTLDAGITYATNPEKTEQHFFTSALNCESCETAYAEMRATKRRFGKLGGVVGYHFIQSFAPGEVTPEQAHTIGVAFAQRLFGDRYEVVVGTHLDKAHLHNHVVVNSVSFVDGKKYHSSHGSYYFDVRGVSDALCRENDLSTIAPQGRGKHYAEWKAEQNGKPTIRSTIRADIDRIIGEAYTYETFLMLLRREGYAVQNRPDRKYVTVLPPGGKRVIRLDGLGDGYTEQDIRRRLAGQREGGAQTVPAMTRTGKRYRVKGKHPTGPKKKITGFQALYLRYLYLLRGTHRKKHFRRVPFSMRQEVIRLQRYDRQFRYLWANGLTTAEELEQRIAVLQREIYDGEQQRRPLYRERRDAADEAYKAQCSAEIDRQTAALREKDDMESRGRLENVEELKSSIRGYMENAEGEPTLAGFLDEVALYTDLDSQSDSDNCVTMMTMHAAKGLEFPVVYVVGMEDGLFPGNRAMGDAEEMEEERRLCYVAMTRAKETLTLTNARQRMLFGRTAPAMPSRFLKEVPEENMEWLSKPQPRSAESDVGWGDGSGDGYASRCAGYGEKYGAYGSGQSHRTPPVTTSRAAAEPAGKPLQTASGRKMAPAGSLMQLAPGESVRHDAFGQGMVLSVRVMGNDALIEVAFDTVGTKKLMLRAAMGHLTKG